MGDEKRKTTEVVPIPPGSRDLRAIRDMNAYGEDSFQDLAMAFHILPILPGKMFEQRGALKCDGEPWNEGFAKL